MNDPTPTPTPSAAQSGLSENAAGGLAYVTIIPAIIFLLVEPYNKSSYIRFHSWQCIFMAIAWIVVDVAIGILARVMSVMGFLAFGLYPLVALGMLILWLMVLIKAFNGERLKLPIVGELAEKQAGR
ncbi:MAG TPA: DUF4870 domain-containing protein [Terracidiphilus sp.]|nr:DUF4870 domain-containing protein [Terracidiphilus sp.]